MTGAQLASGPRKAREKACWTKASTLASPFRLSIRKGAARFLNDTFSSTATAGQWSPGFAAGHPTKGRIRWANFET